MSVWIDRGEKPAVCVSSDYQNEEYAKTLESWNEINEFIVELRKAGIEIFGLEERQEMKYGETSNSNILNWVGGLLGHVASEMRDEETLEYTKIGKLHNKYYAALREWLFMRGE